MQAETLSIAYFGKVPVHADFVRRNAAGTAVRALDEWLRTGLFGARAQLEAALDAAYARGTIFPFYFLPRQADQALVGVMGPSRDSVGRKYPFLIAFEVAEEMDPQRLAQVPVQYSRFFEAAATVLREATSGAVERHSLDDRIDPLGLLMDGSTSHGAFQRYLHQERLMALWERLWGHPQDSRKYLLFKNLFDILLPLRGHLPGSFPLVLRFPLGADSEHLNFEAAFWLEVCLKLLGGADVQPTFFWMQARGEDAQQPSLLLALRPPSPRMLGFLLGVNADSDTLCELERMGAANAALAALSIPAQYGKLLEDEALTLGDFLREL